MAEGASGGVDPADECDEAWFRVSMPGPGGELDLILEARLYITHEGFGRVPSLYPMTIVPARYGGSNEGGASWLAFPVPPHRLAEPAWRAWDGDDIECAAWHEESRRAGWPVGRGSHPAQAQAALLEQVARAAGVTLEELTTDPAWPPQAERGDEG